MSCPNCTDDDSTSRWDYTTKGCMIGAGMAATAVGVTIPLLLLAGFGPAGIIAGSLAAGVQGTAITAGSLFASCQSVAASGIALTTATGIIATSSIVGGVAGKAIDKTKYAKIVGRL